jgi:hypothetical protein
VGPAKEAVGVVVVEAAEDSVVAVAVEVEVEAAAVEVVAEEVAANQQQQQCQPPTHLGTGLKGYHPPYFEGTLSCSTCSNKNGDYIRPPTSIMMT